VAAAAAGRASRTAGVADEGAAKCVAIAVSGARHVEDDRPPGSAAHDRRRRL